MPEFPVTHRLCEPRKSEIRLRVLAARRDTFPEIRAAADAALCEALRGVIRSVLGTMPPRAVAPGKPPIVAGYAPIIGEPGGPTLPAVLADFLPECRILLPVVLPDLDLDWAEYTGQDSLRTGRMGVREPTGQRLGPQAISEAVIVIVPALAVDLNGVRLGRGGGSFDRALARVPKDVAIITPLYAEELFPVLPAQPHDRPVTAALLAAGSTTSLIRVGTAARNG